MFCGNALHETLPPYVVYKAKNLYDSWMMGGPEKLVIIALKVPDLK